MSVSHLNDGSSPYADFTSEDPEDLLVVLESDLEEAISAYESTDQLNPLLTKQAKLFELNTIDQMLGQLDAEAFTAPLQQAPSADLEAKLAAMTKGDELSALTEIMHGNAAEAIVAASPQSLPAQAPFALDALAASQEQSALAKLLTPPSAASIGGPYWGAELPWKRDTRTAKGRPPSSSESDGNGDDPSSRTRKRQEAWRKYQETALERRLNGQDPSAS